MPDPLWSFFSFPMMLVCEIFVYLICDELSYVHILSVPVLCLCTVKMNQQLISGPLIALFLKMYIRREIVKRGLVFIYIRFHMTFSIPIFTYNKTSCLKQSFGYEKQSFMISWHVFLSDWNIFGQEIFSLDKFGFHRST